MAAVYGNPAQGYVAPPGAKVDKYGYIEGTQAYNDMNAARAANPNLIEGSANPNPTGGAFLTGNSAPYDAGTGTFIDKPVAQTPTIPQPTVPGAIQPDAQKGVQQYTTQKGDTLSDIAKKYGVNVSDISGYASGDPNKIGVGENLSIKANEAQKLLERVKDKPLATNAADANKILDENMSAPEGPNLAQDLFDTDPYFQELQKMQQDYYSPENQRKSLTEEYKSMLKESGIEALDMDLINMKNVIDGTEDDIRNEVVKAGGFATDSQVLALTNARNKQLIKNYNTLLETRNAKSSYLDKMMTLTAQDRADADRRFDSMMNFEFKKLEYRDKMKQNAIAQYNRIIDTAGYDGLFQMAQASGDPTAISRIGKTLGMNNGGLKQLADIAAQDRARKIEKENLQTQLLQSQLKTDELQRQKIIREINERNYDPSEVLAYAQQYASTGQIPTGLPKGSFGLVSQIAKELPKQPGALLDTQTGIKSSKISAGQEDGITALFDLTKKLNQLTTLYPSTSKLFPTKTNQQYMDLKNEVVDLLARARTGAVISASEEAMYQKKIPNPYYVNFYPETKLEDLRSSLSGKLDTWLGTTGTAIYGYSKVKVNGRDYVVGDVVQNEQGQVGRINADGSVTIIQ